MSTELAGPTIGDARRVITQQDRRLKWTTTMLVVQWVAFVAARVGSIAVAAAGGYAVAAEIPHAGVASTAAFAVATLIETWNPSGKLARISHARDTLKHHLDDARLLLETGSPIDVVQFVERLRLVRSDHRGDL